ncbi:GtrA family protein [Cupriavidus sp. CV2]|uniref:GtrA family protein n=1 Tax=Cupriavidus ulmosensis TaxID=3065913 RepID=UPI00296AE9B6|nr:GtrA family protein [Cupriavidus sp. CV2]MDW3681738.1 GtrA family protein [Cupriavidus sp. CV2]
MEQQASGSPSESEHERRLSSTFFRYVLVGLLSNAAGYGIYLLVTWLGVRPMLAMSLLYSIGATLGFVGNRQWAFSHDGKALHSLVRYWATHLIGYGLNFSMLYFFADRLGYSHQLVQAVAVFAVAGFLFLMFNFFVFPRTREMRRL